jgi:hypothetical protein
MVVMHPRRRVTAVCTLAVVIVALALATPPLADYARGSLDSGLGSWAPNTKASLHDTAAKVTESSALDLPSTRGGYRSREGGAPLGLGITAAVLFAAAMAALLFQLRSARDRMLSCTISANGMRAPPILQRLI